MAATSAREGRGRSIREVLGAGWRLFLAGLAEAFPWVLAAELLQLVPGAPGDLLDTDLSEFLNPAFLAKAVLFGGAQALFYAVAVARLTQLASKPVGPVAWSALRAIPSVLIGYIAYTFVIMVGLGLSLLLFALGLFVVGPFGGLVLSLLGLGPTAAASTALVFFIYPAVIERRGPFASLSESSRLARKGWVRASLVVTVPALAILVAWLVGNGTVLSQSFSTTLTQLQDMPADVSVDQLQGLLSKVTVPASGVGWGWKVAGALTGALAWWYTLAVCYAEYLALKEQDSESENNNKGH